MGQSSSHPVSLPPSHFLPISPAVTSDGSMKAPPPGCPMHANPAFAPSAPTPVPAPSPPRPAAHPMSGEPPAGCPMHDPSKLKGSSAPVSTITSTSSAPKGAAACPIDHSSMSSTTTSSTSSRLVYTPPTDILADLNPLNQMPELSQSRLSDSQQIELSTDREISTIPRTLTSDEDPTIDPASKRWVYPSAQQFYNALLRKGQEAPEEDIESMVFVHNVLNELAWREVLRWEGRRLGMPEDEYPEVELTKFKGRPGTLSPKAQLYLTLGYFFPDSYNTEPPFDRHDWIIRRPATSTEHRYIIDYYSAPDDPDGSPNFNLDIRPALDDFGSVKDRLSAFLDDWQNGKL